MANKKIWKLVFLSFADTLLSVPGFGDKMPSTLLLVLNIKAIKQLIVVN